MHTTFRRIVLGLLVGFFVVAGVMVYRASQLVAALPSIPKVPAAPVVSVPVRTSPESPYVPSPLPPVKETASPEPVQRKPVDQPVLPNKGFNENALHIGDRAPDFSLRTPDGTVVQLAKITEAGPVVLVFGSYSSTMLRMKNSAFEALAHQWKDLANVYFIFSKEAYRGAAVSQEMIAYVNQMPAMDTNRDGVITLDEFHPGSPHFDSRFFDLLDLNQDGQVTSPELLIVRRIDDFKSFTAPSSYAERVQTALRYRREIHGVIPILIDEMDNPTYNAYGRLENGAFVIARGGLVKSKMLWAVATKVELGLLQATGKTSPPPTSPLPPDLSQISALLKQAQDAKRPILIQFTAPQCVACKRMDETTLADPEVKRRTGQFAAAQLGVEHDDAWALFFELGLKQTPAFVILSPQGQVRARLEGVQDRGAFLSFLSARP